MTFRSFPPLAATASLLCLSWCLAATTAQAQTPATAPSPSPSHAPKPKVAHMRFLNMLPLDGAILELFGAGSTDSPLQVAPPSNFYVSYLSYPPVHTTFRVFSRGNRQSALKAVDAPFKPEGYYTLLGHIQPDGQPTVEFVDESPDPDVPPTNRLTVRQFFRGAKVTVTAAGTLHSNFLSYGEAQTLANLPDGTVPLTIVATITSGGPPRTLNSEVNFQRERRATIFIVADAYGRLRPRVTNDGPSRAEEDAAIAELHAAASSSTTQ